MRSFLKQAEKALRLLTGLILIPFTLTFFLLKAGLKTYNFSGLLSDVRYHRSALILSLFVLVFIIRCLFSFMNTSGKKTMFSLFILCAVLTLFIPYKEGSPLSSSLHLLCAYSAFTLFTMMMFFSKTRKHQAVFSAFLFLCLLICIKDGEVSGPAELIYAVISSIMLALTSGQAQP